MSTEAHAERLTGTEWDGGALPYRVGHRKLGMWLFIVSDAMTFSAMLIAYSYARASSESWPTPFPFNPSILFSTTMTLCLLASSFTMVMAVKASAHNHLKSARRWIGATMVGGLAFLILHLIEWKHLIDDGLRPFRLADEMARHWPSAPPLFGASFFSITGLHMFHVLTGVLYLGWVALRISKTRHEDVEISGLYWHFVDLVWMFVFPLIYLMSVDMTGGGGGGSH
ncbi:MAG TPA: cytochrome c oxidase subunit 3 [Pyrinomonadaceae bacterium]|nr:cytochrome c oxidase subunit 3 [Pyrinomonadaceae bacterium]